MGPQRFILGSICPSTPFERYCGFTSPSKRDADSKNFWRLSNTDAPVYVHWRAVFPALRWCLSEREKKLSNRLAASSFFQSFRRHQRRQSPISQLICQLSQLIFDRSHVNSSHDVPACKVIALRTRLCVRGPNSRVGGQRKRRMERWKMRFGFHLWQSAAEQSIPFTSDWPSSVPCVAVFNYQVLTWCVRGYSSVVERSLRMWEATGSNPVTSTTAPFFFFFFFYFSDGTFPLCVLPWRIFFFPISLFSFYF